MSVHWPIIRRCFSRPAATAVIDDQRRWSRLEILAAAFMLADEIDARAAGPTVGFLLPTSGLAPVAALATWITGRTVVPLNYLLKREELEYVLADCGCNLVITARPMLDFMGYRPAGPDLFELESLQKAVPSPRWPAFTAGSDLAVLLYTSGTSGRPKGVMLSHDNLSANIRQCTAWASLGPDDLVVGVLPQFHSFGLTVLTLLPLTVGFPAVFTARFVPGKIVRLFRQHRPSLFIGIPSMFNALLHAKDAHADDFSRCKYVVSGGEPLPQAVFDGFRDRFGVTINEGYGLTETSPVTNWCRPDEFRRGSVGRPLPGVRQRIVSIETGHELPPHEDGEIRTAGPNLMQGYFRRPQDSAAALDEQGFLRTGDIGRTDTDGHLYITGRLKEMLIIGGENVFPREIEEVLNAHPAVKDSGVIGRTDPVRGEEPVAFVELKEGATLTETDARAFCRQRLAGYKVPAAVRVVDALPRNSTGKVLRRELKNLL